MFFQNRQIGADVLNTNLYLSLASVRVCENVTALFFEMREAKRKERTDKVSACLSSFFGRVFLTFPHHTAAQEQEHVPKKKGQSLLESLHN